VVAAGVGVGWGEAAVAPLARQCGKGGRRLSGDRTGGAMRQPGNLHRVSIAVVGSGGGCGGAPKLGKRRCWPGSLSRDEEEDEEEAHPMDLGPGRGGWCWIRRWRIRRNRAGRWCRQRSSARDEEEDEEEAHPMDLGPSCGSWW